MHFSTLVTLIAAGSTTGWAAYVLEDDYMKDDFFGQFSFWTAADPTNGFVDYVDQGTAQSTGLINSDGGKIYMGVNDTAVQSSGRQSVRLTSAKSYQSGLVVIDIAHMPGGVCGTWPAFWTVGPDWPNQGEIDIIEGVNDQSNNDMTLHTGPGCSISKGNDFSGSLTSTDCTSSNGDNQGCQIQDTSSNSFGSGFNSNGGGVYAMNLAGSSIDMYFFPRGSVPSDALGDSPDPSSWGSPVAHFSGDCDISSSFTNQQLVFDTTFCGDWAGQVWSGSSCASSTGASTCEDFVANNPEAFKDAYWSINALKVYSNNGGSSPSAPPYSGPSSSAVASQPQSSGGSTGWGAPSAATSAPAVQSSSFVTKPSSAPAAAPTSSSAPGGWAPVVTNSGQVISGPAAAPPTSAPAAPPPAPSSPAEQSPPPGGWPGATHTWGGAQPWHSGAWGEYGNGNGAYAVGTPARQRRHARHLGQFGMHGAAREKV